MKKITFEDVRNAELGSVFLCRLKKSGIPAICYPLNVGDENGQNCREVFGAALSDHFVSFGLWRYYSKAYLLEQPSEKDRLIQWVNTLIQQGIFQREQETLTVDIESTQAFYTFCLSAKHIYKIEELPYEDRKSDSLEV